MHYAGYVDTKLREYKEKQKDILDQMKEHTEANEKFYFTANAVFNLSKRAVEVFESSEIPEKRAFLNYLIQNPTVKGKKLYFSIASPFNLVLEIADSPTWLRRQDSNL